MKEKWMVMNRKACYSEIMKEFGVSDVIARLLVNRGMDEPGKIREYLYGKLERGTGAASMKDLVKACDVLTEKIQKKKRIRVIGDYDVDGIISTYILYSVLKEFGADADYQIPDRVKDGYGMNMDMIDRALEEQVDTIITCDNGISAAEQTAYAKRSGMTVLITDHHDVPDIQPEADAVVNPKQADCPYPYKELCGAGVVYRLAEELYRRQNRPHEVRKYVQFLAVAVVCDVMELSGENRILVKEGILQIQKTQHLGLNALIHVSGIEKEKLNTYHLGYILGPCLNAAGRLDTADLGVKLLLAEDAKEAAAYAEELHQLNQIRKEMTQKAFQKAVELIEGGKALLKDKVLLVYLSDCHESLAGIIAGRLRERYYKPCFVLTKGGEYIKGSGRSIERYHMFQGLNECREHLIQFGGHPLAAGLSLQEEKIPILRAELNTRCSLSEDDFIPKITIDAVLALSGVNEKLIADLDVLEPYGKGNAKPVFADKDLELLRLNVFGKTGKVIKLLVRDRFGTCMDAVYFGDTDGFIQELIDKYGEEMMKMLYCGKGAECRASFTYYPSMNVYNGVRSIQIVVQNYIF